MEFIRGEILYDKFFYYSKAKQYCDKLLLVLNKDHVETEDLVIIPATTNQDVSLLKHGCNESEKVFYFEKKIGFYDPPTVLQFEYIEVIDVEKLEGRIRRREIERKGKIINAEEFGQIINCLKRLKDDIRLDAQKLIF